MGNLVDYDTYSYNRYRAPSFIRRKWFMFVMGFLAFGTVGLAINCWIGFIKFPRVGDNWAVVPQMTFYTNQSEIFPRQTDANAYAVSVRANGGAGYLLTAEGGWTVVTDISSQKTDGAKEHKTKSIRVNRTEIDYMETFAKTFAFLETEPDLDALKLYFNDLYDLIGDIDNIYFTYQLFAVNLVLLHGEPARKNALCWVAFSFDTLCRIM